MISCVWLLVFYCYLTLPQNQQLILICMSEVQGRFSWALVRISQDKTRRHLDWALMDVLEEINFQNHSDCWQILIPCDCVQVFGSLLPVSEGLPSAPRGFFPVTLLQQQAAEVLESTSFLLHISDFLFCYQLVEILCFQRTYMIRSTHIM